MDPRTSLRKRVGDTPLLRCPNLAEAAGLPNLRLKMEGANPTGTQKDRIARLEVGNAAADGFKGVTVGSCGNFGVAVAHAAYVHDLECHVFVPEDFRGERIDTMEGLGATVHRIPGAYEDAVRASAEYAKQETLFDANPGGASTLRTLIGYSTIAKEILERSNNVPAAVGLPIGNGSTLAGVHMGFRTAWARGEAASCPKIFGGSSRDNNPIPMAIARGQETITPIDPRAIQETDVNEPLVNWDALDGNACLVALHDSGGTAYGVTDETMMELHEALLEDRVDAHPASLAAVAALMYAADEGLVDKNAAMVAVLTSGRPQIQVTQISEPEDMELFLAELAEWLGRFGDPRPEMEQAVRTAFKDGFVLQAMDAEDRVGYCVLTPMELSEFFPKYHLSYIAVSEKARGRGLGTVLLEDAIRVTDGDVSLHVETDNENAIRLYEKFGFERKYYRMIYKGREPPSLDPAAGSGWQEHEAANGAHAEATTQGHSVVKKAA